MTSVAFLKAGSPFSWATVLPKICSETLIIMDIFTVSAWMSVLAPLIHWNNSQRRLRSTDQALYTDFVSHSNTTDRRYTMLTFFSANHVPESGCTYIIGAVLHRWLRPLHVLRVLRKCVPWMQINHSVIAYRVLKETHWSWSLWWCCQCHWIQVRQRQCLILQ